MDIGTIILKAHSGWAYLLLLVITISTINALIGHFGKKEFGNKDFSLALIGLIVTHIQLLLGIALYFMPNNLARWDVEGVMKISEVRMLILDHPIAMILAVALLTIGYSKHKKKIVSAGKFKMLAIFYTLAFLLIIKMLPWW